MPAEGQKSLYLLLRYVFIASASYLLLFHAGAVATWQAAAIALALTSNVVLSLLPPRTLFAWWMSGPLLVADTVWVASALYALGGVGEEFFLLYLIVLLLAAVSENLAVVVAGAVVASFVNVYTSSAWTSPVLLRGVFLFTVAVFYGHVLRRIGSERRRGDRSLELARELEVKVAERTVELQRLYEASRATNEAKTGFLASVSHELRTPLHIVIGYADMLVDGAATTADEAATLGGHVRRAATGLLHLVDSVLEIGRLESGTLRVERRSLPVAAFAKDLTRREWIVPNPGVSLRWELAPTPASIETDPGKLEIVLSNLVTNALKYTRAGEVVVGMHDHSAAACVEFSVADTGPGIPPTCLARMREPFHESTGTAHRLGGLGLGLAIVYRYAALLDIDVRVESTVGRGTTFLVTVPHAAVAAA